TTEEEKATAWFPKVVESIRQVQHDIPISVATEDYAGRKCSWLQIPIPFIPYEPCMAILDGGLVICTNRTILHDLIDTYDGHARSVSESTSFEPLAPLFEGKVNSIRYENVALSTYTSSKALERGGAITSLGGQHDKDAKNVAFGLRRGAKLMAILGICQGKAKTSVLDGDFIRSEEWQVIRDLPGRITLSPDMRGEILLTPVDVWLPEAIRELRKNGQEKLASVLAQKASEWMPEEAEITELLADMKLDNKEVDEAIRLYREAFKQGLAKSRIDSISKDLTTKGYVEQAEILWSEIKKPGGVAL
ncbi:MAG: hypothetical protein ABIH23_11450, partial [bacterium]